MSKPISNGVVSLTYGRFNKTLKKVLKAGLHKSEEIELSLGSTSKASEHHAREISKEKETPNKKDTKYTYSEIPDAPKSSYHSVGHEDELDYLEPERKAEEKLGDEIENLVSIDENDVTAVREKSDVLSKSITSILLEKGAASLMSYDESSSYVQAVMKDVFGIDADIDSSVPVAISHMLKLKVINEYINSMDIPEEYTSTFMYELTLRTVEDAHSEMSKGTTSDKYSQALQNLNARLRRKSDEGEADNGPAPTEVSPQARAALKRRSGGPSGPESTDSDSIHNYNKQQHDNVRFS